MQHHPLRRLGVALAFVSGVAVMAPGSSARADEDARTLLAIFAHPDDEQAISPMLARYAREGVAVHVAFLTGGQKGVREHAGIPAGEELAAARAEEARCACRTLGIEPPILVGLEDGELYEEQNKAAMLKEIARLLSELNPDVVVTWGPDGVTGHTDHRLVSSAVTQVVQRGAPDTTPRLYYSGLSAERLPKILELVGSAGAGVPRGIAVVHDGYLPVRIAYGEEDARRAGEALACHKSQYTPEELARMTGLARLMEDGAVRLRPWFVDPGPVSDVFQ
jgi:LmbE family N-acetylglucosaminyl deacetylase